MTLLEQISFPNLFSGSLEINRIAFSIFGLDIYWYGILIALGVVLGFVYAMKRAKSFGLIWDKVFDVAFFGAIAGFIGARAYFVIFYNLNPDTVNKYDFVTAVTGIRDGGLAIYGGIIGSVIVAFIVAKINKTKFLPLLDLAGLGFLIGQCIGRWGNFVNQEAFGAATAGNLPWGMTGSVISQYPEVMTAQAESSGLVLVHPCFLYESLLCLVGFVLLHFYSKKLQTFDGEIILLYTAWYGVGRGFIEGLRLDSLYMGDFRTSQVLGFATAAIAIILFVILKIKLRKGDYKRYRDREESIEMITKFENDKIIKKELANAKKASRKEEKNDKNN